jgi:predicted RNA-binding Zn-ribbon protein involved in translation (DUF1610 family)
MRDDEPITAEGCRKRAAHCATGADRTSNEHVRQLLRSMEGVWLKLATETERLDTARRLAMQQQQMAPNEAHTSVAAPAVGAPTMVTSEKPKSRLLAHAPLCSRCNTTMKVRTLRPGRKVDVVAYRCEECGEEVVIEVKRER